jgi:hypothetical protein
VALAGCDFVFELMIVNVENVCSHQCVECLAHRFRGARPRRFEQDPRQFSVLPQIADHALLLGIHEIHQARCGLQC